MTTNAALKSGRRQLMIHDGAAFLILTAVTGVLFAVTLFLFRSFSSHRADLAVEASDAGKEALAQHRPHDAIASLREALSYAPNQRDYQLLLAQALGEDGRIEEANNYFLNLREAEPGDGFINLQLARLARQRKLKQQAVDFYRASIFGDWKGEGDVHRRRVRLELADFLIGQKDLQEAQSELVIAASNARSSSDPALDMTIGDAFLQAGDSANALRLYQKAMIDSPRDPVAYEKAGRIAYRQGDFAHAAEWLEHALRESAGNPGSAADPEGDTATLQKNSERLLALAPAAATTRTDRVAREIHNRALAKQRFDACLKQSSTPKSLPSAALQNLAARWTSAVKTTRIALLSDRTTEADLNTLIGDTEILTAQTCGPPKGDDGLLLILAQRNVQPTR
ncbi:tetratricopeptide (TPR) repeat protein [Granulicella aggregans]|uniref:Tetratricopeptide (TPR) repeat protein n=1 Tax=Granulicella aggregans TaxID=474949 RepID=A0A7W8E5D7_9BACT|nr:tetratricopeptide repeat protein [Granulicella aggregans]MBB5059536.1 tetratricopeptide (TPR) repeat protein [Granulicella aggregans]